MIGIDQEPNRATLDRLNAALGEGKWSIEYRETPGGVAIVVQTREVPARVWSSQVAHGVPRESVDGVWSDLTSRIVGESKPASSSTPPAAAAPAPTTTTTATVDAEPTKRSKPPLADDSRSLEKAPASNPESHGYPPIPDDLIKPRDVEAEPGNPGEYGTRDYERQADGTYKRKPDVGGKDGAK